MKRGHMRNGCSWWCCWLLLLFGVLGATSVGGAQERSAKATSDDVAVFKAQTSLVLVDAIVTDKQGKYVRDLSAADFHVWEDGKEQVIKSFSSEASGDAVRQQYLVMLFDDANSSFDEQVHARKAALAFLDAEITGNQFISIARFENALQVTQNFTRNIQRLKDAASGKKMLEGTEVAGPAMVGMQGDFHARNLLLAVRSMALSLSKLPGRKAVLLFSPGFALNSDRTYELSAAIDACNRSNVAIYAINVRGLTSLPAGAPATKPTSALRPRYVPATLTYWGNPRPAFLPLVLNSSTTGSWRVLQVQTGTGGGQTPRPPTRSPGTRPSTSSNRRNTRPPRDFRAPRLPPGPRSENLPWFSGTADFDNRQVLHALAEGTGGFVFENSNDLLAGVHRIGQEQSHYYILGSAGVGSGKVSHVESSREARQYRGTRARRVLQCRACRPVGWDARAERTGKGGCGREIADCGSFHGGRVLLSVNEYRARQRCAGNSSRVDQAHKRKGKNARLG